MIEVTKAMQLNMIKQLLESFCYKKEFVTEGEYTIKDTRVAMVYRLAGLFFVDLIVQLEFAQSKHFQRVVPPSPY